MPIGARTASDPDYVFTDHIGYPVMVMDPTGSTTWSAVHEPYGEAILTGGTTDCDPLLRYPGQWKDDPAFVVTDPPQRNLFANGYRWYNPDWGRYTQSDPIGLAGGINPYAYANSNPHRYSDPLGLFCTRDFVDHYFSGGGSPIDLGAVGLLGDFLGAVDVAHATANFANRARRRSKAFAIALCHGRCGSQSGRFSFSSRYAADVTNVNCLFAVGNTSIKADADCDVAADCTARMYAFSCNLNYGVQDAFKDPADIFDLFPGDIEIPGGTPYAITANWYDSAYGTGSF